MTVALLASASRNTAEPLDKGNAYLILTAILLGLALLYWLSLRIHPYAKCGSCKGAGRSWGGVFTNTFGLCRRCGGTGRKQRLGVRMFMKSG